MRVHTIILALCILSAPYALAQSTGSASTEITITGEAKQICRLSAPSGGGGNNASFANNNIAIVELVDDVSSRLRASSVAIRFSEAMCNYPASLSLLSRQGGLVPSQPLNTVSGPQTFLTTVPYTVTATWGPASLTLDTTATKRGTAVSAPTGGLNNSELSLIVQTQVSSLPVPAGTYSDVILLQIGAKL